MGAACPHYVEVLKSYKEWIKVYAVTNEEAAQIARLAPDVLIVLKVQYEAPDGEEENP